jgi:hypothetical protein
VIAGLRDRDSVERGVELPVAAAVEPVALDAAGARFQRCDAAVAGELDVTLEPLDGADLGEQLQAQRSRSPSPSGSGRRPPAASGIRARA